MIWRNKAVPALLAAAAMLAAGCSGIGDGVAMKRLIITAERSTGSVDDGDYKAVVYQCLTTTLRLDAEFTNGQFNSPNSPYTARATWSSSDETVVRVSNRDIPVPGRDDGSVFVSGTLVPVAPGTATVTASFAGLREQITVEVRPLAAEDLQIRPETATIAPGTFQLFQLLAQLDGEAPEALSRNVLWQLAEDATDIAEISPLGVVIAHAESAQPLTVAPQLPLCADGNGPDAVPTASVAIERPVSLRLRSEFDGDVAAGASVRRVNGLSAGEFWRAIAVFGNDAEQDLTEFTITDEDGDGTRRIVRFESSDENVGVFSNNLLLLPLGIPGTIDIRAGYQAPGETEPSLFSESVQVESVDGVVTALRLIQHPAAEAGQEDRLPSLGSLSYRTEADFDVAGQTISHPVTRSTTFSSSNTALVGVEAAFATTEDGVFVKRIFSRQRVIEPDVTVQLNAAIAVGNSTASDSRTIEILRTACSNELDDDEDGLVDGEDPGCENNLDLDESDA